MGHRNGREESGFASSAVLDYNPLSTSPGPLYKIGNFWKVGRGVACCFKSKELTHFSQYMPCGFLTEPRSVYSNGEEGTNANRLWKEFPPQRFVFLLSNCINPGPILFRDKTHKGRGFHNPPKQASDESYSGIRNPGTRLNSEPRKRSTQSD